MDGQLSSGAPRTWHRKDPGQGTAPVGLDAYVSPDFFEAEREKIFRAGWINMGRVEEMPEPGDYLVRDLRVAHTSILIVRGKDGQIRGFHNMCAHRGNPVAWHEKGRCRGGFTCKFHGWVYDDRGRLVHISDEGSFFDIDKSANGLTPVHTDVWQGFIFVNLADTPKQSLAEFMAPVTPTIDGYPFDAMRGRYTYRPRENVNWKTLCEAQQEGWHLPYLHDKTLAKSAATAQQDFRHAALIAYGPHGVVSSSPPEGYKPSKTTQIAGLFGSNSFDAFSVKRGEDGERRGPKWHGAFDLYFIFPNFFIGLLEGTYFTYNIWPEAVDRSVWEIRLYYPEPQNAGQVFAQEFGKCGIRDTLMEDAFTHEKIQSVISSGAKTHFHLSDEEHIVRHFHNQVRAAVEA